MSPQVRSRVMARIRSKDTQPELHVRRAVWAEGFRYRLHQRRLPGAPDLAFAKYRLAVFIHGCFWHQHGCAKTSRPSSNTEYWDNKLDGNVARDARNQAHLKEIGWTVITIWECNLRQDTNGLLRLLESYRLLEK